MEKATKRKESAKNRQLKEEMEKAQRFKVINPTDQKLDTSGSSEEGTQDEDYDLQTEKVQLK